MQHQNLRSTKLNGVFVCLKRVNEKEVVVFNEFEKFLYYVFTGRIRGWLHGQISARAEIPARLLTYGKEKTNLNKKHEVCVKI